MENQLEKLLTERRQHKHGCRVCGNQTAAALSVMLRETISQRDGQQNPYGKSVSRQLSLCSAHAVEMWERIVELLP